jgi:alkylated DNA repair dioxygenase AlkB
MFTDYHQFRQNVLNSDQGLIDFFPSFLTEEEAKALYQRMLTQIPFQQNQISLFGKKVAVPRLEAFYAEMGKSYGYSGQTLHSNEFPDFLLEIKTKIEQLLGTQYNALLVNLYRDGNDSNGWHADNEKSLGVNPSIASLSLGVARRFELRHNRTNQKLKLELTPGSLLHMHGSLQHHWKHQLPKVRNITEPRINLTFRKIVS